MLALKIESFRVFATVKKNYGIYCNFKILSKMKMLQSIVYLINQLIFFGGREIAQGGGESKPKVSLKFSVNFGSSKFHQYRKTNNSISTALRPVFDCI